MDKTEQARILNRLPMVTWDRCISDDYRSIVYGWIGREDGRSDFVTVEFIGDEFGYTTSSAAFSIEIHALLYGEESADDHIPCDRVEEVFGNLVERTTTLP